MTGPYPPHLPAQPDGPPEYGQIPSYSPAAPSHQPVLDYPSMPSDPGTMFAPPPHGQHAEKQPIRYRRILFVAAAIATAIGLLTATVVYGIRTDGARSGGGFTDATAKTAIQGYLNALEHHDIDTIVRNALCGLADGVKDKRSDQALARLSSEAVRKQFSQIELTSIDKIVHLSDYQAQVLFSVQVKPAAGGQPRGPLQGIAQLLYQNGQITVCSYVMRAGGTY